MRARRAMAALLPGLLAGAGCSGDAAEEQARAEVERPRLKAWDAPASTVPSLLSNGIHAVAVDTSGAAWIGTNGGGITRYHPGEGTWKTFTTRDGLPTDDVRAIAVEPSGAVWACGWGSSIGRFDPRSGTWRTFSPGDGAPASSRPLDCKGIAVGAGGMVWIATAHRGVHRVDPGTGAWKTLTDTEMPGNDRVSAVAADKGAALWFVTSLKDSLLVLETGRSTRFVVSRALTGLPDGRVNALALDTTGSPWIGLQGGVARLAPANGTWTTIKLEEGLADRHVTAVAVEATGAVWMGIDGGGVRRHDPKTGAWSTFTTKDGLGSNDVRQITLDGTGGVWLTTGNGVSRRDPKTYAWTTFTAGEGLPNDWVEAIAVDRTGGLWFGTMTGARAYDPKSGAWTSFTTRDGLANDEVQAIAVDEDAIWFGTTAGASRYDPKARAFRTFTTKDGLANDNVWAIAVDPARAVWFGTHGAGVTRYDPRARGKSLYYPPEGVPEWKTFTRKDGLASDDVTTIAVEPSGAVWFGAPGAGATRHDPESGTWNSFARSFFKVAPKGPAAMGIGGNDVADIEVDASGVVWFALNDFGVSTYSPDTRSWGGAESRSGRAAQSPHTIAAGPSGTVWLGGSDGEVSVYDPAKSAWASVETKRALDGKNVHALAVDGGGALWVGAATGAFRLVPGAPGRESGAVLGPTLPRQRVAVSADTLALTRPHGVTFVRGYRTATAQPTTVPGFPRGAQITAVVAGPNGTVWAGTQLGGLTLLGPAQGKDLQLTTEQGLPSMTVTALAPVPGTQAASVWAGTSAGVVRVRVEGNQLQIERVPQWDGMPTGPVDALAAKADGSVFVAYNAAPARSILDPDLAIRRTVPRVFHWSPGGDVREITTSEAFRKSEVRSLEYDPKHGLWAGTSEGLFLARDEAGSLVPGELRKETEKGHLPSMGIQRLVVAPDDFGTLWMAVERPGDSAPQVVGYRPGTSWVYILNQDLGVPMGGGVDDLTLTPEGELIVSVGNSVARGRVFVPVVPPQPGGTPWPWIIAIGLLLTGAGAFAGIAARRNSHLGTPLRELELRTLPRTLARMRFYRVFDEAWSRLGLPETRIPFIHALASPKVQDAPRLRALAALLGMENASAAEVRALPHGLSLLAARLPSPAPVRDQTTSLVAVDLDQAAKVDPVRVRETLEAALNEAGQRFELPFVVLAHGAAEASADDVSRDLLPADLGSLRLGERELKALLFAKSPEQTFAGLLHTRGLIGLSPYDTSGAVKDTTMFFGRVADLRELLLASAVQHIVVGPRRVGKTSLLKRLLAELPKRRPDVEPVFVDLLGIAEHTRAARTLARALKVDVPEVRPGMDAETLFVEILRRRFEGTGKKGVVLVDEADGLIEADAKRGFPLLSAMRAIQAEEVCSFVLAGYLYLYREAMNQRSPLYNFATLRILGPLDPEAARDLATMPMARLGVTYADAGLPDRIVAGTGGYPSFVQLHCDAVLKELSGGDLVVTTANVEDAAKGPLVASKLGDIFRLNAGPLAQIAVYSLLDRDDLGAGDMAEALRDALGRAVTTEELDGALLQLRIFGFLVEREGRFTWAIPLLRDTLRAAEPALALARVVEDLRGAEEGAG